ncbi:MAG TPA: hypothetical protein EYP20_00925 [Aigarchaeota archaeon]|nr:hypothetical protein [Aigarchaeota archaeon]
MKIPRGEYVNIGIAEDVSAEMRNLPLLAPSLAEAQESPWAGVFSLSAEQFYHIAVGENSLILPGGEVIGSKDIVKSAYFQNLELLEDWKHLNADSTTEDLYNLLLHSEKRYHLRGSLLEKLRGRKVVIPAFAVLFALGLGTWLSSDEEQITTQLNPSVIQNVVSKTETNVVMGVSPGEMVEECFKIYAESMVKNVGWTVTRVVCAAGGSATVFLSRDTEQKVVYVSESMEIEGTIARDVYSIGVHTHEFPSRKNPTVESKLIDWFNLWEGVNLIFPYDVIEEGENVVVKKRVFEASGSLPLPLGELAKIEGIALTEMEISPTGWRVKGIVRSGDGT